MDYSQFRNPDPPQPKPKTAAGTPKTVTAQIRAISFLWGTTVEGNPFGTDGGIPDVPHAWPGDLLRKCRQWHGVDLTADFRADGSVDPASIRLVEKSYSGQTESCGFIGKTTVTDRHVTEPLIGADTKGKYVEVKSLLGTRLGAFVPEIGAHASYLDPLGNIIAEAAEQASEDQYLGIKTSVPKIFTYVKLKVYADAILAGYVSDSRADGFVTQEEIIAKQLGSSWIPEHHIYLNGVLSPKLSRTPISSHNLRELKDWLNDKWRPERLIGLQAMTNAMIDWVAVTPRAEKLEKAADFRRRYPDYFIGTTF